MIVYGANIKPLTGELTVTHQAVTINTLNFNDQISDYSRIYTTDLVTVIKKPISQQVKTDSLCECLFQSSMTNLGLTTTNNAFAVNTNGNVFIKINGLATVQDYMSAIGSYKLVYELATPITYQLTPTEVRSLLGLNNIWADCGAITELKYTRDLNLCINDIISRIEALEGASSTRSLSVSPVLTKSIVSDSDTAESILEGKTEETEEETKEEAQNER